MELDLGQKVLVLVGVEVFEGKVLQLRLYMKNTEALGQILYTKYLYLFQASGMVLLVAMVGAIMLTLRKRPKTRRQSIAAQLARKKEDTLEIRKVGVGGGIG